MWIEVCIYHFCHLLQHHCPEAHLYLVLFLSILLPRDAQYTRFSNAIEELGNVCQSTLYFYFVKQNSHLKGTSVSQAIIQSANHA